MRRRPLSVPDQIGVAIVLEDRHAVFGGEPQQFEPARLVHDRAGRILHGRDGVNIFRPHRARFQIVEHIRQHVHPHAAVVERNADSVDAEPRQPRQRTLIAGLLDDDGVAAVEQNAVDQIERLQRAGGDEDFVGGAGDAGIALELLRQKFAQRPIAERPAGKAISGEVAAFARQHVVGRFDDGGERKLIRIVMAADEIIFRKAVPFSRRRRQVFGQKRREIERWSWMFSPCLDSNTIFKFPAIRADPGWRARCNCYGRARFAHPYAGSPYAPSRLTRLAPDLRRSRARQLADFPDRPIHLIVPQAAGSATDTLARLFAASFGDAIGQQIVVDDRPGGALTVGMDLTAKSPPDGYTLCMAPIGALALTPHMVDHLPYDIAHDFQPIVLVTRGQILLAASPTTPFKTVKDIIDYAKENPGKLLNASSSNGSPGHVDGELFKFMTGTNIVHVPYKGGASAINDLIAGRVQIMFESLNSIAPFARSGQVRGARGERRSPLAGISGSADHRRGRRARLLGADLDRRHRAGRPAAADHRQAQRRREQGAAIGRLSRRASRRSATISPAARRRNSPR